MSDDLDPCPKCGAEEWAHVCSVRGPRQTYPELPRTVRGTAKPSNDGAPLISNMEARTQPDDQITDEARRAQAQYKRSMEIKFLEHHRAMRARPRIGRPR